MGKSDNAVPPKAAQIESNQIVKAAPPSASQRSAPLESRKSRSAGTSPAKRSDPSPAKPRSPEEPQPPPLPASSRPANSEGPRSAARAGAQGRPNQASPQTISDTQQNLQQLRAQQRGGNSQQRTS